jgi:hypothetical protein
VCSESLAMFIVVEARLIPAALIAMMWRALLR